MFISISIFVRNKLFFVDASNMRKYLYVLSFDGIPKWTNIYQDLCEVKEKKESLKALLLLLTMYQSDFELKSQQ